jgi:pyruvate formate lyase activating enzyme
VGELTATVLNIQRMSTEDGPGIRTTVFLKGCTLTCSWCHNPESIASRPQLVWNGGSCIGCHGCLEVCPTGALQAGEAGITPDRELCEVCGACTEECPSNALELLGQPWTVDALTTEVAKDRPYFARSAGGVTVSGGEPGVQAPFVAAFLRACQEQGLHTVLDTCGACSTEALMSMAEHADLVLYDVKLADEAAHAEYAGRHNREVLDNLDALARSGADLWIRTPLIPGITATADNVRAVGRIVADRAADRVERWELCAFNNLCEHKYTRLGLPWTLAGAPLLTRDQLDRLCEVARLSGVNPERVHVTGAARLEEARR